MNRFAFACARAGSRIRPGGLAAHAAMGKPSEPGTK